MRPDVELDAAVFELSSNREMFTLVVLANGEREELASGLLEPFLHHLKKLREKLEKGAYALPLVPPTDQDASWFTPGTIQRFVRFVNGPQVVEKINAMESEILQIEQSISFQSHDVLLAEENPFESIQTDNVEARGSNANEDSNHAQRRPIEGAKPIQGENSKSRVIRMLESQRIVLRKKQDVAFAEAAVAGFDISHMSDLVLFANFFGAIHLRDACLTFMEALSKRQEAELLLEETEPQTLGPFDTTMDDKTISDINTEAFHDALLDELSQEMLSRGRGNTSEDSGEEMHTYLTEGMPHSYRALQFQAENGKTTEQRLQRHKQGKFKSSRESPLAPENNEILQQSGSDQDTDTEDDLHQNASHVPLNVKDMIKVFEKKSEEVNIFPTRKSFQKDVGRAVDPESKQPKYEADTGAAIEGGGIFRKHLQRDGESSGNVSESDNDQESNFLGELGQQKTFFGDMTDRKFLLSFEPTLETEKKCSTMRGTEYSPVKTKGIMSRSLQSVDTEEHFIPTNLLKTHGLRDNEHEHCMNVASHSCLDKKEGHSVGNDFFFVPSPLIDDDQRSSAWEAVKDIDSENPQKMTVETAAGHVQLSKAEVRDSFEHAQLSAIPEKLTEENSIITTRDSAIEVEVQVNITDRVHSDVNQNDSIVESKNPAANTSLKRQPKKKISGKESRSTAAQAASEKRKADMAEKHAKQGKPSPLTEAQMRAEKIRAYKSELQKARKEKEEEGKKRLEELKMQRQQRVAAKTTSSPSFSKARAVKQRQLKPAQSSKQSSSVAQTAHGCKNPRPASPVTASSSIQESVRNNTESVTHKQNGPCNIREPKEILKKSQSSLSIPKNADQSDHMNRGLSVDGKRNDQMATKDRINLADTSSLAKLAQPVRPVQENHMSLDAKRLQSMEERIPATGSESKDRQLKGSLNPSFDSFQRVHSLDVLAANKIKLNNTDSLPGATNDIKRTANDASEGKRKSDEVSLAELHEAGCKDITQKASSEESTYTVCPNGLDVVSTEKTGSEYIAIVASEEFGEHGDRTDMCLAKDAPTEVSVAFNTGSPRVLTRDNHSEENQIFDSSAQLEDNKGTKQYFAPVASITSFDESFSSKPTSKYTATLSDYLSESSEAYTTIAKVSENDDRDADSSFHTSSTVSTNKWEAPQPVLSVADSGNFGTPYSQREAGKDGKSKEVAKGFRRFFMFGSNCTSSNKKSHEDEGCSRRAGALIDESRGNSARCTSSETDDPPVASGSPYLKGSPRANSHARGVLQGDVGSVPNTNKASRFFFSFSSFRSKGNDKRSR